MTTLQNPTTFPAFYDPAKVGQLYLPQMGVAAAAGQASTLTPANQDSRRTMLLLVDPQIDFIFKEGSLSVPGAIDDTRRTIEWIYRNAGEITNISTSLDSHTTFQIFYPTWWGNDKGEHPAPYTQITADDIHKGIWKPLVDPVWSIKYVRRIGQGRQVHPHDLALSHHDRFAR